MKKDIVPTHHLTDSQYVDVIKDSIDNLTKAILNQSEDNAALIGLVSAIVGGLLVISGQFLVELFKTKENKKTELNNVLSELVKQKGILKNLYRELAMYKTHASYWWFCTLIAIDDIESEVNRQDHLKSQSEARKVEREIGESIAFFLALIVKFEDMLGKVINLDSELEEISELKTRAANEYTVDQNYNDVRSRIVIDDEENLKKEYFQNIKVFDTIILKLRNNK